MSSSVSVPNEQVVFTDFDGKEGILVDLNTKKYYQLNETAMLVWKALERKSTLDEIIGEVTRTYEVSSEHAAQSVGRLLDHFRRYNLVS
jgi:hypothetical protein